MADEQDQVDEEAASFFEDDGVEQDSGEGEAEAPEAEEEDEGTSAVTFAQDMVKKFPVDSGADDAKKTAKTVPNRQVEPEEEEADPAPSETQAPAGDPAESSADKAPSKLRSRLKSAMVAGLLIVGVLGAMASGEYYKNPKNGLTRHGIDLAKKKVDQVKEWWNTPSTDQASKDKTSDDGNSDQVDEPPAEETPADDPPAEETPADDPPVEETPADDPPAEETPADDPPAEETPADEPPAEETPADDPPAEETPADDPPAEETPADDPPAEETPADDPPAEETPADDPPAEETPADDPPAEETPADDPPAEETPADDPPAEEAPPAEGTPTEEPTADEPPAEEPQVETPPADETPDDGNSDPADETDDSGEDPLADVPQVENPLDSDLVKQEDEATTEDKPAESPTLAQIKKANAKLVNGEKETSFRIIDVSIKTADKTLLVKYHPPGEDQGLQLDYARMRVHVAINHEGPEEYEILDGRFFKGYRVVLDDETGRPILEVNVSCLEELKKVYPHKNGWNVEFWHIKKKKKKPNDGPKP